MADLPGDKNYPAIFKSKFAIQRTHLIFAAQTKKGINICCRFFYPDR
jgi:hypothetical protein